MQIKSLRRCLDGGPHYYVLGLVTFFQNSQLIAKSKTRFLYRNV